MPDRTVLRAGLLVLLAQRPSHGYEVLMRFRDQLAWGGVDRPAAYRTLRSMEAEGLLASAWGDSSLGPRRRLYSVTAAGHEVLERLVHELSGEHRLLAALLLEARRTILERAAS